jgi:hypothetical protein
LGKIVIHDAGLLHRSLVASEEFKKLAVDKLISSCPDQLPEGMTLKQALGHYVDRIADVTAKASFEPWLDLMARYALREDYLIPPDGDKMNWEEMTDEDREARWALCKSAQDVVVDLYPDSWQSAEPELNWYWTWFGVHPETKHTHRIMNGGLIQHEGNRSWSVHT